jgi:hypothetical protein
MAPRGGGRNHQEQSEDDSMINEMGGQMEQVPIYKPSS